jgi:transposase
MVRCLCRVDQVIEVVPSKCRHCDSRLARRMPTQGEPRRHQVTELPPIEAHIIEYRCQCAVCPECGKATQAELPEEAQSQFGPQLTALIAYLTVACRLPRRMVRELLKQVLTIPLSLGSIQNSWEEVSEAVAEPCAGLERQLPNEPVVNSDETGYRTSGKKRWLWLREETVRDYAELARLGHVTRARMTQIMKLVDLAPDLQEKILFPPPLRQVRRRTRKAQGSQI